MRLELIKLSDIQPEKVPLEKYLQTSLLETDQKDPIKVRVRNSGSFKYEIVGGKRRVRALREIGQETVLALIVDEMGDLEFSLQALISNAGKPNPMDEAYHLMKLKEQYTLEQISKLIGYSVSRISQTLKLVDKLHPNLQTLVADGDMKVSAAIEATKMSFDEQEDRIINKLGSEVKPTLKFVQEEVRNYQSRKSDLFDLVTDDVDMEPGLFISSDQVHKILSGETIQISWKEYFISIVLS